MARPDDMVVGEQAKASDINAILDYLGYAHLTVKGFQFNPATGDFATTPEHLNDDNTATAAIADTADQYAEVLLPAASLITQFRLYGDSSANGTGRWKVQYLNAEGSWTDWVTGITQGSAAEWGSWNSSGGEVVTLGIRLVCTTVDGGREPDKSYCPEMEVKY